MLEFSSVSKSFWTGTQRKVILDRASFRVELGTSLGILAPNGTGKTTLINMMAGLEKPDEGTITRTCRVSFRWVSPAGSMANCPPWKTAAISRGSMVWIPTMSKRSAGGFAGWKNTLTSLSAFIPPACGHGLHSR